MTKLLFDKPIGIRVADLADACERATIDGYVRAHPDATPFHLTAWSAGVAKGCGQRAHYLVAEQANGAIAGVLPLTEIRSALFGRAMVSTGFGVGGGILAGGEAPRAALAQSAWDLAQRRGCPSLELRGGPVPAGDWQIEDTTYIGFARDLAADDETELLAIPRKQRAEVRKALGNGLAVRTGRHNDDVTAHYAVYAESVRNLGTPVFPSRLFSAMLDEFGDSADILVVTDKGRPVASVLSLYLNGTVYPYWGGGIAAARALRANDAMYFELMRHARARGCTRFDFGRSKAGTGAAAFKKNWGFEGVPLRYARRITAGGTARDTNPNSAKYRAIVAAWRKLPLPVANFAGPFIARGLG